VGPLDEPGEIRWQSGRRRGGDDSDDRTTSDDCTGSDDCTVLGMSHRPGWPNGQARTGRRGSPGALVPLVPLVPIYRKFYGTGLAMRLTLVFWVVMATTG